jgi:hypothetical protein
MFNRDKKIRFIQNGVFIPSVGRVYHGKELFFPAKEASRLVNLGYAEFVVETPIEDVVLLPVTKVKKNGRHRRPRNSESASEDRQ